MAQINAALSREVGRSLYAQPVRVTQSIVASEWRRILEEGLAPARTNSRDAITELIREEDPRMRALAWKILGEADLVDDVLQDAYLKVFRSIEDFRGDSQFGTWLHRIVVNTCLDHARKESARREVSIDTRLELVAPDETGRVEDSEHIRRALLALPFEQRVAVLLVDCEGYTYEEAADQLKISLGALGSRLFRARASLEKIEELI